MYINGEKLKEMVYREGYTLKHFNDLNGFSDQWLYHVTRKHSIGKLHFYKLAKALGVEPEELEHLTTKPTEG